jgi:hypothetical protein
LSRPGRSPDSAIAESEIADSSQNTAFLAIFFLDILGEVRLRRKIARGLYGTLPA